MKQRIPVEDTIPDHNGVEHDVSMEFDYWHSAATWDAQEDNLTENHTYEIDGIACLEWEDYFTDAQRDDLETRGIENYTPREY